jgi:acetylornithine/succinyldiaminopimelate/putrescine aminotransferase
MVGVTLAQGREAEAVAARALAAGLVINVPGPGMLRFLPPLIVDEGQIEQATGIVARSLG